MLTIVSSLIPYTYIYYLISLQVVCTYVITDLAKASNGLTVVYLQKAVTS